jgi:putative transposase
MQWKKQALSGLPEIFSTRRAREAQDDEELKAQLYQQIGQLKVELDWLKKRDYQDVPEAVCGLVDPQENLSVVIAELNAFEQQYGLTTNR